MVDLILAALVQNLISKKWCWRPFWIKQPVLLIRLTPTYGSHFDNSVKVIFNRTNTVRIGIVMVDLVGKMNLYLIVGVLAQMLFFQDVDGGHLVCFWSKWYFSVNPSPSG